MGHEVQRVVERGDRRDHADRLAGVPADAAGTAGVSSKGRVRPSSRCACSAERRTVSIARCTSVSACRSGLQASLESSPTSTPRRSASRRAASWSTSRRRQTGHGSPRNTASATARTATSTSAGELSATRPTGRPCSGSTTAKEAGRCHAPPEGSSGWGPACFGDSLMVSPGPLAPKSSTAGC